MTTPPPLVTGVDFVTLAAGNFDAAVEFYGTVLGLPCSARYGRVHGAEFETGNLTIQLFDFASVGRENKPSQNPVALHVDDVEAARAELESRGVVFLGDTNRQRRLPHGHLQRPERQHADDPPPLRPARRKLTLVTADERSAPARATQRSRERARRVRAGRRSAGQAAARRARLRRGR